MKNRGKVNLILNLIMFITMLTLFCVKGEIHETLAYTLGGLLILHIVLHWKQIKVLYRQLIPQIRYQYLVGFLAAAAIVAVLTMPLYVNGDSQGYNGDGRYEQGPPPGYDKES